MTPDYEIYADGKRVTPIFKGRLLSISVTDQRGDVSDDCVLTIEDSDGRLATPRKGAGLEVHMGYAGQLARMGFYIVDAVEVSGPPDQMRITAKGASFTRSSQYAPMQTRKSRSWDGKTIGEIATTIAQESSLGARISPEIASKEIAHVDQTDESDLNLLGRILREHDAFVKPTFGQLVILSRAEAMSVSGKAMPVITLNRGDLSRWSANLVDRQKFGTIITYWHDSATGLLVEETTGTGQPVFRTPNPYASQEAAIGAGIAYLSAFERRGSDISLVMPGRTDVRAEAKLIVQNVREGVDGTWVAKKVDHVIDRSGYRTTVVGEVFTPRN